MNSAVLVNLAYIVASILFIFGLKMLGSATTARRGNLISAVGMLIAVVAVLLSAGMSYQYILIGRSSTSSGSPSAWWPVP